jgi:HlyD family secretion protein
MRWKREISTGTSERILVTLLDAGYRGGRTYSAKETLMSVYLLTTRVLRAALVGIALCLATWALDTSETGFSISSANAQSNRPDPLEKARTAVETLINRLRGKDMPDGIIKTNGRIQATEVDVAAKYSGRLAAVNVDEGDEVTAGQVVATISSPETEAQLLAAQAVVLKSKHAVAEAEATIVERQSDYATAQSDLQRAQDLVEKGWMPKQTFDQRLNKAQATEAVLHAAEKARDEAQAAIAAAEADVKRLQSILVDLVLVSPRSGRVQYRLARAGEVVAAGQRVLTILDLKDVYMTIYLPSAIAGQLMLGDEARVIADPIPEYVLPATISFVATDAQFTPKSVETAEERQKLMFRVKLQGDPKFLDQYHRFVKTGIRGLGFVRTDPKAVWPPELAVKLPPQ